MIQAVIFDLNGVLVTTDECHYQSWLEMAGEYGIAFDRDVYARIRGLSRPEAIEVILKRCKKPYSEGQKLALSMRKNDLYLNMIGNMNEDSLLPGAIQTVNLLRKMNIHTAVCSSSQNARLILKQLRISDLFNAVVDGNQVENLKPAPDAFLLAAQKMNVRPDRCLVIEDAPEGVEAAHRGGMRCVGLGAAAHDPAADYHGEDLGKVDLAQLIKGLNAKVPAGQAAMQV